MRFEGGPLPAYIYNGPPQRQLKPLRAENSEKKEIAKFGLRSGEPRRVSPIQLGIVTSEPRTNGLSLLVSSLLFSLSSQNEGVGNTGGVGGCRFHHGSYDVVFVQPEGFFCAGEERCTKLSNGVG
ncbi:uncharacterized protein LOC110758891 [Prunus avium]|uniref:Uncharacterized protein LOC110758891 n=1 Tax=Prunus avium TaxID=42229 RepID=A0A6P5SS81_PRUAV|nr:uncharacterized protein LOC110758891 [Prunus avium]